MKIEKVVPFPEGQILIFFDDKSSVNIDMKNKMRTIRFSELRNKEVFNSVSTDGRAVLWCGGLSMAISEIMELNAQQNLSLR